MKAKVVGIFVVWLLVISSFTISAGDLLFDTSKISENFEDGQSSFVTQPPPPGDLCSDAPYFDMIYEKQNCVTLDPSTLSLSGNLDGLIWQIDESLVEGYVLTLEGFGPRVTGTSTCYAAGDYLYNAFQGMDLDVRRHHWESASYDGDNIEATIQGEDTSSDKIYVVCAHYDSVPGSPGADDNGAGVAAVLAAAEVMSQFKWNHTIRFVTFSGEEQGLYGSHYYAQEASDNGDNIIAALNADMIGYAEDEEDRSKIKVYSDGASHWVVTYTADVSQSYNDLVGLSIIDAGYASNSDHASFWSEGYNAIMYHEYHFNPYYHSPQDTSDKMDMDYNMRVSRLIMATLGELAGFIGGGGGSGGHQIPPVVKITSPFEGEVVNDTITISGNAFCFRTYIKHVCIKIGGSAWLDAEVTSMGNGMAEWTLPWDTKTVDDGSIIISAVSINREGLQSPVDYATVTVKNEEEPEKNPDLECTGALHWSDITPKVTVSGEFIIENVGDSGSELSWEIVETPSWGDWTFHPSDGSGLTPENGAFTVNVLVVAPDEKEQSFTGEIKIVNSDDPSDYCSVDISLATPKAKSASPLFIRFLENHPYLFPLFRNLIGL